MLETSRLMLCMFAMSILFFNPFSLILPSSTPLQQDSTNDQSYHPQAAINSRVLNSMDLYEGLGFNASTSVPNSTSPTFDMLQMLGWFLNSIVVFFCLAKVYIGSDPVGADSGEKSSRSNLWMNYQKACQNFQRKNYTESAVLYKQGLRELGLIAPESKSGLIIGIVWQVIRLCLDKVYIGRVFLKLGWWIYGTADFKVYKQSALFYFELHKFAYLNMKSEREVVMATSTKPSTFSYLTGLYYILASYNMCEVYSMDAYLSARDEYNLCEIYFSLILYFKFYVTSSVSKCLVKYLLNQSFLTKKTFLSREQIQVCKLNKLKNLLTKSVFIHFLTEFNVKVTFDFEAGQNKSLSLISYKRKLFSFASFLYDSDESVDHFDPILPVEETGDTVVSANGIACDYILSKFQEFILFKMTDQVVNRIGVISTEKIVQQQQTADSDFSVGTGCLDCAGDELRELAEVDEIRFDGLLDIYRKNLDYFRYSKSKFSNSVIEETQFTLVQFLKMCNRWKLRNFEVNNGQIDQIKNSYNSEFIESITSVLKACECLSNDPRSALDHCSRAVKSLRNFNDMSGMNARSELVEKFEILINDWLLSAQSQIWTEHKLNNIGMFNETLQNFQTLIVNFPELNFKAKMYETILMYASNRNPINLINPTSKQMFFSNCNKEAFSSMNEILKNFRLQITD